MMLTIENLNKSYGDKILFQSINCTISRQDRIGLIGVNGTGKSTFLKTIAGIERAESGEIKHPKDYRIEYLAQEPELDENLTVMEHIYYGDATMMISIRGYEQALQNLHHDPSNEEAQAHLMKMQQQMDEDEAWEANTAAKTILTKLGIQDFDKQIMTLSGGQKKRVALAKSLIQPADLLILDEPTNHLDNDTVEWLEAHLRTYQGALLLVTHDRYFLNRVTNYIFELDKGNFYIYEGNYEVFLERKAEREALEVSSQQKHANTLRRELAWLQRGARARSTKQKARIERVDDLKGKQFSTEQHQVDFKVGSTRLGKQVIELTHIDKSFHDVKVIDDFSRLLKPDDRIGIIGPNGAGKTTLLNIMAGRVQADHGDITVGETVKIGYYTQGEEELDGSMRIIDYIKEVAQEIYTKDGDVITAEQMLEHFLFSREEQYSYIRKLSGGERRRLYLLKVLMTEPNVLFLDEPTNDLDTQTLSVLEEYLHEFPGVVITISHDRYFLDRVVDQLLVFSNDGKIDPFYGNYSEYLAKTVSASRTASVPAQQTVKEPNKRKKLSYLEQQEWNGIEEKITELEVGIDRLKERIAHAGSDITKVQKLYEEQEQLEQSLEKKMDRWEELSLLIESFEKL